MCLYPIFCEDEKYLNFPDIICNDIKSMGPCNARKFVFNVDSGNNLNCDQ